MDPPVQLGLFRFCVVGGLSIHPADVRGSIRWTVCCYLFFVLLANEVHAIQCPVSLRCPKGFHSLKRYIL